MPSFQSSTSRFPAPAVPSGSTGILAQAIPGLPGLQTQASNRIRQLMSGVLSPETQANIQDAAATQAVASGMPGSSRIGGTLMGNRVLRDIGLTTENAQQQGFGDLMSLLGVQGNIAATANSQNNQANQFQQELGFRNQQLQQQDALERARMALEERRSLMQRGLGPTGLRFGGPTWSETYRNSAPWTGLT